jgi:hypothetical protein
LSEISPKLTTSTCWGTPLSRTMKSAGVKPRRGRRDESVTSTSTRTPSTFAEKVGCIAIAVVEQSTAMTEAARITWPGS